MAPAQADAMAPMANPFGRRTTASAPDPLATVGLKQAVRKLWADHVIWTRLYVMAAVDDRPEADAAAGRLLKNQEDIGASVAPYYGAAAGERLTGLLKKHIMIAVDLVAAAKSGKDQEFAKHDKRWTANAEEIATFLSGANPHWPKKDLSNLLALHLSLTKAEAVARITKDWANDVKAFDDIFVEINTVADALADGIVKQFPERFGT
jgi:hypothetical protein